MRSMVRVAVVVSFLVGAASGAYAKCGDNPGDDAAVLAARQQVQTDCHCDTSTDHGAFVSCAANVANSRSSLQPSDPNFLPKNCKGAVKKCAAKSVCGKSGFVTCCVTKGTTTKCKTKKDAAHCTAKGGTVSGTSSKGCASCCDVTTCPPTPTGPSCASPSGAFLN